MNKPESPKPPPRKPLTPTERREFAEVNTPKTIITRWPEARRQEGLSRPDEPSARESFYALAGDAIKAGQVGADKVNEIVRAINQNGYDWGLGQLQAQMAA